MTPKSAIVIALCKRLVGVAAVLGLDVRKDPHPR